MKRLTFCLVLTLATLGLLFIPLSISADSPPAAPPPDGPGSFLSEPAAGDPLDIALNYLRQNRKSLGLTETDLAEVIVKDRYTSQHNQVTHIYLRQRLGGIEVFNGDININIDREGRVINLGSRFVPDLSHAANRKRPLLTAVTAAQRAAQHLKLTVTQSLVVRRNIGGADQKVTLSSGGISQEDIPVKLMYQPVGKSGVRLAWNLVLRLNNDRDWWNMTVDAVTGEILHQSNWIADDTYQIYPVPVESPTDGARTLMANPADLTASPYGWHDTDGITGAEYTDTRGNNVFAQEDVDSNDTGGFWPDGGSTLDFDFPIDLEQPPSAYQAAAITNLFYWNNLLHDIHYHYGFDEAGGNFQENPYGRGGAGGDPVQADAQDGSDTNNANFATPPEGSAPRMQMFLFTGTDPDRDGDLDNGVIIHEYGHGISNRLTGGPSNVDCLSNTQSGGAGEGWSDWWALVLTAKSTDGPGEAYPVGTYVLGEPADGPGIRRYPYSTDRLINPLTYGDLPATGGEVHAVGEIWAVTLWDMYWNLVADHGFDTDLYSGHGGNNLAMQLVMDGLKLQPCSPTFLDARDAILQADVVDNAGTNRCRLWEAFAKRGMGVHANDGGSDTSLAVTENFDLPVSCLDELVITKSAAPSPATAGKVMTYTLVAENYTSRTLTGVLITDTVPANTTYVPGSASDGGAESAGVIRWNIDPLAPDTTVTRTFQVVVSPPPPPLFFDDMESGSDKWTVSHGEGTEDWVLDGDNPYSGSNAWFASDPDGVADQYLAVSNSILVPANGVLSFWHSYSTEESFDGGVVEISSDGGATWTDLGPAMIRNGYNSSISDNPIGDRPAFSGSSGGYVETIVDLSGYSGMNVQIRFCMASDISTGETGWYIDDVSIQEKKISNTAYISTAEGDHDSDTIATMVSLVPEIAISPAALASTQPANAITTKPLTISNVGTAGLTWAIYEQAAAQATPPGLIADDNPHTLMFTSTALGDEVANTNLFGDDMALTANNCTFGLDWASVSAVTGITPGSASTPVDVTFDSTGLKVGSYHGNLCVGSNDPVNPEIIIPLRLDVIMTDYYLPIITKTESPHK